MNDTGIKVQRVLDLTIDRMACGSLVPSPLQTFERAHDLHRRLDGVKAFACMRHVSRLASDLDPKPDHAEANVAKTLTGRLRQQRAIGPISALQRRQRTNARALFFDHGLEVYAALEA